MKSWRASEVLPNAVGSENLTSGPSSGTVVGLAQATVVTS